MDDLTDINAQTMAAAGEADAAAGASYQALAAALGNLSPAVGDAIVKALLGVLTALGGKIEPAPTTVADPAVARGLDAISALTTDALAADAIADDLLVDVGTIDGDEMGRLLLAQLKRLATDKGFLKWATSPTAGKPADKPAEKKPEKKPGEKPPMTTADEDAFMASRMGA